MPYDIHLPRIYFFELDISLKFWMYLYLDSQRTIEFAVESSFNFLMTSQLYQFLENKTCTVQYFSIRMYSH